MGEGYPIEGAENFRAPETDRDIYPESDQRDVETTKGDNSNQETKSPLVANSELVIAGDAGRKIVNDPLYRKVKRWVDEEHNRRQSYWDRTIKHEFEMYPHVNRTLPPLRPRLMDAPFLSDLEKEEVHCMEFAFMSYDDALRLQRKLDAETNPETIERLKKEIEEAQVDFKYYSERVELRRSQRLQRQNRRWWRPSRPQSP